MFGEWWTSIGWAKQIFWSLAVVASFLLFLWLILHFFWQEFGQEEETPEKKRTPLVDAKSILLFFVFFCWSAFLIIKNNNLFPGILYAVLLGGGLVGIFRLVSVLFSRRLRRRYLDIQKVKESTGEVLVSIPPHRNGFGKVHLNLRGAPNELEAMTAGQAIQPGMSVRVIDVIENEVLVVEPVPKAPNLRGKDNDRNPISFDR